ncbi:MAG: DUF6498-containing protein [Trueperaceae bacterium]|nr:DUF6498-containing protein [Trueperaceae bacterium]
MKRRFVVRHLGDDPVNADDLAEALGIDRADAERLLAHEILTGRLGEEEVARAAHRLRNAGLSVDIIPATSIYHLPDAFSDVRAHPLTAATETRASPTKGVVPGFSDDNPYAKGVPLLSRDIADAVTARVTREAERPAVPRHPLALLNDVSSVLVNFFPMVGVAFLAWEINDLLHFFWLELTIIAAMYTLQLLLTHRAGGLSDLGSALRTLSGNLVAIAFVAAALYGTWRVIYQIYVAEPAPWQTQALVLLGLHYAVRFVYDFVRQERQRRLTPFFQVMMFVGTTFVYGALTVVVWLGAGVMVGWGRIFDLAVSAWGTQMSLPDALFLKIFVLLGCALLGVAKIAYERSQARVLDQIANRTGS